MITSTDPNALRNKDEELFIDGLNACWFAKWEGNSKPLFRFRELSIKKQDALLSKIIISLGELELQTYSFAGDQLVPNENNNIEARRELCSCIEDTLERG